MKSTNVTLEYIIVTHCKINLWRKVFVNPHDPCSACVLQFKIYGGRRLEEYDGNFNYAYFEKQFDNKRNHIECMLLINNTKHMQ